MEFRFNALPKTKEELFALPEAACSTPFEAAAMTVLALAMYPENRDEALACLDALRGPRPLSNLDRQFLADRFRDGKDVPRSYFAGSTPASGYEPAKPYTLKIEENPYSYQQEGYATLWLASGGADNPRQVQLRLAKDGKWYLWEQFLMVGIRPRESQNPWA